MLFQLVCVGWLLFRAATIGQAWEMFRLAVTDFRMTPFARMVAESMVFYAVPLLVYEYWVEKRQDLTALDPSQIGKPRATAYSYAVLMLIFFPAPKRP